VFLRYVFRVWTFINCILIVSLCDCHTHSLKATWYTTVLQLRYYFRTLVILAPQLKTAMNPSEINKRTSLGLTTRPAVWFEVNVLWVDRCLFAVDDVGRDAHVCDVCTRGIITVDDERVIVRHLHVVTETNPAISRWWVAFWCTPHRLSHCYRCLSRFQPYVRDIVCKSRETKTLWLWTNCWLMLNKLQNQKRRDCVT